ncbi:hypothetical protein LCGC14_2115450 [marine sediment metagenome]|uniref:Uncharacterized protein n=1 Tax=marine sediment metagenome TaxID=412755 RepID=A0A0F9GIX2_9ZZZZ
MINGIGNTAEFRKRQLDTMTDAQRDKFDREMEKWAYLYPFTAAVMLGNRKLDESEVMRLVKLGEERRKEVQNDTI